MLYNGTDLTGRQAKTCSDLFLTYLILDPYKADVRLLKLEKDGMHFMILLNILFEYLCVES